MGTENTPKKSNMTWIIVAVVAIVIIVAGVAVYYLTMNKGPSGNGTPMTLYEGEVSSSSYGFGLSSSSLSTNPGPTITLKAGQSYTMTVYNVGTMPHNWAIVGTKDSSASVLFGAKIGSAANPIAQGSSSSVTFTAGSAGNYFYICQIPGHVALGMWGNVVVNP